MSLANFLGGLGLGGNIGGNQFNPDPAYFAQLQVQAQQESRQALHDFLARSDFLRVPIELPRMSHLGTVPESRRKFKEYSKAEFREIGNRPVIKDILSGMTELNKEEIKDRIAEHLAAV